MKKKKIWSSISRFAMAFLVIASWAVLGVALALKSAKVEIGGGITFTATGVYAQISGRVTGTKTTNTLRVISISADTQESFTTPTEWSNMTLDFKDASTSIVVKINIQNRSNERDLWLVIADNNAIESYNSYNVWDETSQKILYNENAHNIVGARAVDGEEHSGKYATLEVEKGTTKELEITLSIKNKSCSVDDNFNFGIELVDEGSIKDAAEYSKLSFATDESTKTASVSKADTSISGDVVIPALIKSGDEIYTVDKIVDFKNCTQMTSITFPASVKQVGVESENRDDNVSSFEGCNNSTVINLPVYVEWSFAGDYYDLSATITLSASIIFSNARYLAYIW